MTKPPLEFPSRLVEANLFAGNLLRQALDEPTSFPSEPACWYGLVEKRERPKRSLTRVFLSATALGAVCTLCLIWLVRRDHGAERVAAYADALVPAATASAPAAKPGLGRDERAMASDTKQRLVMPKHDAKSSQLDAVAQGNAYPAEPASDTSECSRMAREGKLESAAACYGDIARGSSMAAELALYEKARLESRALGRGAAALSTLDEHARRFPQGVLATEVSLTRIELLTRLGRTDDALGAVERALGGTMGKERGGDLYALRGDLLSSRGDCPGAMAAYASARSAGIHPTRLQAGEKRCAASTNPQDSTAATSP